MLLVIATALLLGHGSTSQGSPPLTGVALAFAGILAGFALGAVASLAEGAGEERLIPALVLLFGAGIKLAGSLFSAVNLSTLIMDFTRCRLNRSFAMLGNNRRFVGSIGAGSLTDDFLGGQLSGQVTA